MRKSWHANRKQCQRKNNYADTQKSLKRNKCTSFTFCKKREGRTLIPNANLSFWYLPINCSNEGTFFKNDKIGKIWITDLSNYLAVWLISWEMFFLTPPLLILSHKQSELCEAYWQWKESTNLFCQIVNQISKLKIHVYLFFIF